MRGLLFSLVLLLAAAAAAAAAAAQEGRPGLGIDARGNPVVDPTENVKSLNEAAVKRQDDLRIATQALFDAKLEAANAIGLLRSEYDRKLLQAAVDKLESDAKLRADYSDKIAATEKARVDAIRLVDTGAVAIANERATATAATLAKTVADTATAWSTQTTRQAEDLRILVKTTADEQTRSLQQQFAQVQTQIVAATTRLTTLEQLGAEGLGRSKFQDPQLTALVAEVRSLAQSRAAVAGTSEGYAAFIGWIMGGLGLMAAVVTAVIAIMGRKTAPA